MGPGQEKIAALEKKMKALNILKSDIEEKFIKAGGRGGQKVNKSSSAVFLRYKGTDLTVKCQSTRSQHLNRFLALRRLVDKIEAARDGKVLSQQALKAEKIRKQKKRRKRKNKKKAGG